MIRLAIITGQPYLTAGDPLRPRSQALYFALYQVALLDPDGGAGPANAHGSGDFDLGGVLALADSGQPRARASAITRKRRDALTEVTGPQGETREVPS
jgi:hypothetical protein